MRSHTAAWLAWSLAGVCVVAFAANVLLYFPVHAAPIPSSWDGNLGAGGLLGEVLFLAFPVVGALIASRRPRNPIGWICLADGFLWILSGTFDFYSVYGMLQSGPVPFPLGVAGINNWIWVPAVGLVGTYLLLLFPDGRLPSRKWRLLGWLSGAVIVLLSIGVMLAPGPLQNFRGIRNPFGLEGHTWVTVGAYAVLPLLPLCMLASALSLVWRYRRAVGEEREQIKWIAFAASVVAIVYLIAMIASFVYPSESWFGAGSPLWLDLLTYGALFSFFGVPLAIGFAVLKYRLYDIDVVINRTLVYGSLTALLVAVYFGGVATIQTIFRALTGQEHQTQLAIVASTLVIAALFNPLRQHIQVFIDRRFYRRKYDATRILEAFSARLRHETDLEALNAELVEVVRETMQPSHISLWLKEPRAGV